MKILYVIPARQGSKGLPGKNIKLLDGKPLIAHSIISAQQSKYPGKIIVSTDDQKIMDAAKEYGAEIPFVRPLELATDSATSIDVLFHALSFYKEQGDDFDLIILLQPTSPLRLPEDIDCAIDLFLKKNAQAVVSVCENEHNPLWSNTIPETGSMKDFIKPEIKGLNRQQLPKFYRLNGAVYVSTIEAIIKNKSFIHEGTYSYEMPTARSVDIDLQIDFTLAECILKSKLL